MANPGTSQAAHRAVPRSAGILRKLRRNEDGATAVEFAMVAVPFTMLLFGIIAVGLFFFTTFSMENAVEQAARLIRTGQVQEGGMTKEQFKAEVCKRAPSFVDCNGKLRVNVQNFTNFTGAATGACLDGGNLVTDSNSPFEPGSAEAVVLVTACYEWDLAKSMPFISLGDMGNGSRLIQASAVFRTEPYSN